jgi:predicted outer membrane repeat protein
MARTRRKFRLGVESLERRLVPAHFLVTSLADQGPGSLRSAIAAANASPGADSITFDPVLVASPGTISLQSRLSVTDSLAIAGPGAGLLTINGNFVEGCIAFEPPVSATASLSGLTIIRSFGYSAGVLNTKTSLAINDCVFAEHLGGYGAIASNSQLTVNNSTFRDNRASFAGGAVYAIGAATFNNCKFINNESAGHAGAIYVTYGALSVTNSLFRGNTARTSHGGAIFAEFQSSVEITRSAIRDNSAGGQGGGVFIDDSTTLNVTESAIVENRAKSDGGGIMFKRFADAPAESLHLRNVTVAGNLAGGSGGGIAISDVSPATTNAIRVRNSTIAANTASGAAGGGLSIASPTPFAVELESSVLAANVHPLTPDAATAGGLVLTHSALGSTLGGVSVSGTAALANLDVKLNPLSDMGGSSPVMVPRPDSPLRNAGANPAAVSFDQRGPGFPRLIGPFVDIGAVETDQAVPQVNASFVNISAPTTAFYEFVVTFRDDAGIVAESIGTGDVTVVGPNGFAVALPELIYLNDLSDGTPRIAKFQFAPPGGAWDAADNGRYTVTLKGGAVFDTSGVSVPALGALGEFEVNIAGSYLVTNANDAGPGSLRAALERANASAGTTDTITFDPAFFSTPRTIPLASGALFVGDGVSIVGPGADKLTLDGLKATRALYVDVREADSKVAISGLTLTQGHANDPTSATSGYARGGGAIFVADGELSVTGCSFAGNRSLGAGGAIGLSPSAGELTVAGGVFNSNVAYGETVTNSPFDDTYRHGSGGALGGGGKQGATISNSTFASNSALVAGGAVALNGPVTIQSCVFTGNVTDSSNVKAPGGAVSSLLGSLTIADSAFASNSAGRGGAVAVSDGSLTIIRGSLTGNSAGLYEGGGAVAGLGSKLLIDQSTIAGNTSALRGGGIRLDQGSLMITNTSLIANSAVYGGGVYATGTLLTEGVLFRNVTASGNVAGFNGGAVALHSVAGSATIENSTLHQNAGSALNIFEAGGGGISVLSGSVSVTLRSTVVAGNVGKFGPDILAPTTGVLMEKVALGTADGIFQVYDGGGNIVGVDVKLSPLGQHGGFGPTHVPLPGSPLIDAGANPANLATDQRGGYHFRVQGLAADIGAVEVQSPTTVTGVVVNDGETQRSVVRSVIVSFNRPVAFVTSPADAFQIQQAGGPAVGLAVSPVDGEPLSYRLRFSGPGTEFGSLADGRYNLTVFASRITSLDQALDGDGDGIAGDNFVLVGNPSNGLFRLFGDRDGDGVVGISDFTAFRNAFLAPSPVFDFDGDGAVAAFDFLQFRLRFLQSV